MSERENKSTTAPVLEWLASDVPRVQRFDDTYFSKSGGFAETQHVFLNGNKLPQRFEHCEEITIGELGFGTGLNFLTTLHALQEVPKVPKLTFISFELFPFTKDQLKKALDAFPEIKNLAQSLLETWTPKEGWNEFSVAGARLLLGIGDARTLIDDLNLLGRDSCPSPHQINPIDAWYLDGFSPAKNPELWEIDLLKKACHLTAENGTLATYTSAGWVRRNLQEAGFNVEKTKGFAGKREMVVGVKA